jgi:ribosomal protein S18 acetylase RimI-like enzyme
MRFRYPCEQEIEFLTDLGNRTGIFNDGEAEELLGKTVEEFLKGNMNESHRVYVLEEDSLVKGWVYLGCNNFQEDKDVWDLWWIGVDPQFQGQGYGRRLLNFVENIVMGKSARKEKAVFLRIETSSAEGMHRTREFYRLMGYTMERVEKDGYGPGEDKIVLIKSFQ